MMTLFCDIIRRRIRSTGRSSKPTRRRRL